MFKIKFDLLFAVAPRTGFGDIYCDYTSHPAGCNTKIYMISTVTIHVQHSTASSQEIQIPSVEQLKVSSNLISI